MSVHSFSFVNKNNTNQKIFDEITSCIVTPIQSPTSNSFPLEDTANDIQSSSTIKKRNQRLPSDIEVNDSKMLFKMACH